MTTEDCRIWVVGVAGSGKTTVACALARELSVPHIELDALYWGPGWTAQPWPAFRERVAQAAAGLGWVIDGQYSDLLPDVGRHATTLVWLDPPRWVSYSRVLRRTWSRFVRRVELWSGNRETLRTLCARESIIAYAWRQHHAHRAANQMATDAARRDGRQVITVREAVSPSTLAAVIASISATVREEAER